MTPTEAAEELRGRLKEYAPFEVSMPGLSVFEQSNVIFAEVQEGRRQLLDLHAELNTGSFAFDEPWEYHPHLTLAQGLRAEELQERFALAVRRWQEAVPYGRFLLDTLTFVQNTEENRWVDLEAYELRNAVAVRR